jgi:uncharacterized protein (TIGR01244 family)
MRQLEEGVSVSGQIRPEEVAQLAAQGIRLIVNNRPDGEAPDQPSGSEIEAAAAAAGVGYRFVPVAQLTPQAIEAMREALAGADGPVLAFCAVGTRSTYLWALARSLQGADGESLAAGAQAAGYDISPIRRFLR